MKKLIVSLVILIVLAAVAIFVAGYIGMDLDEMFPYIMFIVIFVTGLLVINYKKKQNG